MVIYFSISSKVISLEPETMSNNTFLAPVILLSFSKENLKPTIASLALFSRRNRDP
jgi:hypothetical protein